MSNTLVEALTVIAFSVLPALLLCIPLLVWVLRQADRRRLLTWGGCGALAGCAPGAGYLIQLMRGGGSLEHLVLVPAGMLGTFFGALVGAHLGVLLTRLLGGLRSRPKPPHAP